MDTHLIRSLIGTLVCAVSVFLLSGCGSIGTLKATPVRSIPAQIELKLSPGDTRQEVRSLLGHPLIDSQRLGVEVYELSGKDVDLHLAGVIPLPGPGNIVLVRVLVVYDDHDVVKDIASGLWDDSGKVSENWINAGGFSLLNIIRTYPPDILVGPPISRGELSTEPITGGRCVLYLLLNDYFMGEVLLDSNLFADLTGLPHRPRVSSELNTYETFNRLFIRKEIAPGRHVLSHNLKYYPKGELEGTFVCGQGETLYARLEAQNITYNKRGWGWPRLEGSITINKIAPRTIIESNKLRPVLWSNGIWYSDLWYVPPN